MNEGTALRRSPVRFGAEPTRTTSRGGWTVALTYGDEGAGPWIVDLSHRRRLDVQDPNLGELALFGLTVPPDPGMVTFERGLVICRMNRTQASIWHLGSDSPPDPNADLRITDVGDGHCALAFLGPGAATVMEHLTSMDLMGTRRALPRLSQGPVVGVPCQVVTFSAEAVLMTMSRGYGRTFVDAAMVHARSTDLRPAGEARLDAWVSSWPA